MKDSINVDYEHDDDGEIIENSYVVELKGKPSDCYDISHKYFDSSVDAFEFAKEVSEHTGVQITDNT